MSGEKYTKGIKKRDRNEANDSDDAEGNNASVKSHKKGSKDLGKRKQGPK